MRENEIEILKKALEFYANSDYYPLAILELRHFEIARDMGARARNALGKGELCEKTK